MTDILDIVTRVAVFILMFVVGTDCTRSGLRDALYRPGLVSLVVLGQFAIAPAVMYGCCRLLGVPIEVTGSLLLMACCPTGSISNTHCYLAKGNSSLSVALTTLSCVVAVVATPLALGMTRGVLGGGGLPLIPARPLVNELIFMMVLPLLMGGVFRHYRPAWVNARQRALRVGTLLAVVILVSLIISTGPREVAQRLQEIAVVAFLFTVLLLAGAWLVSRVFRLSRDDRWAVLFEWPCRNLAIALVVGINLLNRPDLGRYVAALFVIQATMLLGLTYTLGRRRGAEHDSCAAPRA